jgi:hypothetical protein
MSKRDLRDPETGKRVLQFLATSALLVSPIALMACGGAQGERTNVAGEPVEERTNVAEEPAAEGTNVDHTAEPHNNVAPEESVEEGAAEEP